MQRICIDSENSVEITQKEKILCEIKKFYKKLYSKATKVSVETCDQFLGNIDLPILSVEEIDFLNTPITIQDLFESIKKSDNGKSPGSDGLTREFFIVFWNDISELLFNSLHEGKDKGSLSTSQRQAVIKLLDKGKDKRFIKKFATYKSDKLRY